MADSKHKLSNNRFGYCKQADERTTKATVSQRVNHVLEILLDGWSRYQIVQMASEKWGIVPRTADKYISRAHKIIHILSEREQTQLADKCERRLQRLYYKALKNEDLNLARNIIKDIRDMFGLDKPSKHAFTDPTGEFGIVEILGEHERAKGIINALRAGGENGDLFADIARELAERDRQDSGNGDLDSASGPTESGA